MTRKSCVVRIKAECGAANRVRSRIAPSYLRRRVMDPPARETRLGRGPERACSPLLVKLDIVDHHGEQALARLGAISVPTPSPLPHLVPSGAPLCCDRRLLVVSL